MSGSGRHGSPKCVLVPEAAGASVGTSVALAPEKVLHLRKVLRLDWQTGIRVLDGQGRELDAVLEKDGDGARANLVSLAREQKKSAALELAIGLAKNSTMDWIVEKAVECGVSRIVPVVCSRSVVLPPETDNPEKEDKYVRRWRRIMDGAQEQSEALWTARIESPITWGELVSQRRAADSLLLAFVSELREKGRPDQESLAELMSALQGSQGKAVSVVIGPEGGFTELERQELGALTKHLVSLGSMVLRVETAVVAALTLARVVRGCNASNA